MGRGFREFWEHDTKCIACPLTVEIPMLKCLLIRVQKIGGACFQKLEEREFLLRGRNVVELCPVVMWVTKYK